MFCDVIKFGVGMCNLKGYYYRIRVNTTPAAYKKIGVFGWWLIEMSWKFVQFLIKKAPKSGLLGKKVAAYLNFNQIL